MIAADLAVARQAKYRQEAKNGMAKLVPSGRLVNVPHEIAVKEGTLWAAIPRLIEKMASVQKVLLGSNAEQMFRQSAVPMLTVGPAAPSEPLYEAHSSTSCLPRTSGRARKRKLALPCPWNTDPGLRCCTLRPERSRWRAWKQSPSCAKGANPCRIITSNTAWSIFEWRSANPCDETGRFHLLCAKELPMAVRSSRWRPGPR